MDMPRMNGKEAVRPIRQYSDLAELKLFVVSGMPPDAAEVAVGSGGVDHWFRPHPARRIGPANRP